MSLQRVLGHGFSDPGMLELALTHRSASKQNNNERLEFLGDAVIGQVIAEELYRRFPQAREGQLTRLRASLVNKEHLAEMARSQELGPLVRLGPGELKSGGWQRNSILADALEAVVGAILLDAGMDACRERVLSLYADELDALSPDQPVKDPKTRLQEWMQSHQAPLPVYEVMETSGKQHDREFAVSCRVHGLADPVAGSGSSIKRAEQAAADRALELLQEND